MNIKNYDRYPEYKDSGEKWLGEIPSHWELSKLGRLLKPVSIKNKAHLPLLSITREEGVIKRDIDNLESNHNFIPDDLSGYKMIKKGQFGMNKMKAWQGSYGVSDYTGIVSPAYFIFDFYKEIHPNFFNLAIRSKFYIPYFGQASDGVRIGQWDLSKTRMKEIPFVIPTLSEQKAIANFLDEKCSKIDEAIKQKEKMIELLKERKQIIIQDVVTKGIDPNISMKDSGVEWIGDIPEHWEVKRFKFCCTITSGQIDPRREPYASQTLIAPNHIESKTGKILKLETAKEQGADSGKYLVKKNDIVYSKIRPALRKACISPIDGLCSADMYVLSPKKFLNRKYLVHYLLTEAFTIPAINSAMRVAMPKVNREALNEFFVMLPPNKEQTKIVDFIEKNKSKIDSAISLQEKQIVKLKEYKETLINDAVTGKIRVGSE